MLSLYLHIPFCRHRCSYCDFNTYTSLDGLKEAYTAALCKEIAQIGGENGRRSTTDGRRPTTDGRRPVHTIFFGGGTPSLMSAEQLGAIMTAVRAHFDVQPTAEISLEANPGTVSEAYLADLRALGVNRLSFGVQSAVAGELALLEREHDFAAAVTAVAQARVAGFENISLDLIYGVPGQTLASWRESVEAVLPLQPEHLSLYCLTIEPGTPMQRWLHNGRFSPPDPDLAADQYELTGQLLAAAGFIQYEISNWARPGRECEHNLTYWRNQDYLGLGAGAHGHAAGTRYQVVKQPRVYIRRLNEPGEWRYPWSTAVASHHKLDRAEAMTDTVITQLRLLREGLDLGRFARQFGQSLAEAFPNTLPQLVEWGLLHEQNDRLLLTERGRFLSNQVFYRFM